MNIICFVTLYLLSNILAGHTANAHFEEGSDRDHHHDEHTVRDDHHHHGDEYRALRDPTSTSFMIGNFKYANEEEFVRSGNRCGTRKPTSAEMDMSSRIVARYMSNIDGRRDQAVTVEVQTYFHVITDRSNGDIDDTVLQLQLDVMNESFRVHGFSFRLMQTTRTDNSDWYNAGSSSQAQTDMKAALRVGDASTLNVYFNSAGTGLLGYATLPSSYSSFPTNDGVVILNDSVPGGAAERYNEGKTLVHEVGHWLGLYHTFQSDVGFFPFINFFLQLLGLRTGCNTRGDEVTDTPAQRTETIGCPSSQDTCPRNDGLDPINNYMDYSDDVCLFEFTPGQGDRMAAMWNEYRASR